MNSKAFVTIGIFIGSTIGSYIPALWGANMFSPSSIICGGIGALIGLWAGFKMSQY